MRLKLILVHRIFFVTCSFELISIIFTPAACTVDYLTIPFYRPLSLAVDIP